jgi:hypothetical protein
MCVPSSTEASQADLAVQFVRGARQAEFFFVASARGGGTNHSSKSGPSRKGWQMEYSPEERDLSLDEAARNRRNLAATAAAPPPARRPTRPKSSEQAEAAVPARDSRGERHTTAARRSKSVGLIDLSCPYLTLA